LADRRKCSQQFTANRESAKAPEGQLTAIT